VRMLGDKIEAVAQQVNDLAGLADIAELAWPNPAVRPSLG
jgi:hypothetical protein